jgi:hypothetical protein
MSHWALLDDNNVVINVVVGDDSQEDEGVSFLQSVIPGRWVKTSYNTSAGKHALGGIPFRKNFAGLGMIYDESRDAFITEKPYNSWSLNEETAQWEPPVAYPNDGERYTWDEEAVDWALIEPDTL